MRRRKLRLRNGWPQAVGALLVVAANTGLTAASTWSESQTAGRVAIFGVVMFVIALGLGSGRLVTATSLPILGAGLVSLIGEVDPAWVRAMAVGVLWYVAAELAWESIERRDGAGRTRAHTARRIDEVTTVVMVALAVSSVAIALSATVAPVRTIVISAFVLVGLALAMSAAARGLRRSGG